MISTIIDPLILMQICRIIRRAKIPIYNCYLDSIPDKLLYIGIFILFNNLAFLQQMPRLHLLFSDTLHLLPALFPQSLPDFYL